MNAERLADAREECRNLMAASMRPRSYERGKANVEPIRFETVTGFASMRPRSYERGKAVWEMLFSCTQPGFNEAAFV